MTISFMVARSSCPAHAVEFGHRIVVIHARPGTRSPMLMQYQRGAMESANYLIRQQVGPLTCGHGTRWSDDA